MSREKGRAGACWSSATPAWGSRPSIWSRFFDVFSQAPTGLDRAKGGLGLGLTLVRALVGMHGGTVDARSEGVGKGSEFRVRLPAGGLGDRRRPACLRAAVPVVHESVRIVLVEDNVDIRETLDRAPGARRLLGGRGGRRPAGADADPVGGPERRAHRRRASPASMATRWRVAPALTWVTRRS